jgi:type II secretory pathway pseudopilin PulG
VISLVIFVASATVIGQLVSNGVRAAVRSRLESQAILRCESKLSEIVAGAITMQATSDVPFTDDSSWTWSSSVQAGPNPALYLVQVKVSHPSSGQLSDLSYTLSRLVRDPNATLQMTTDQQAKQKTSQSSSSSSTGTSSSTGGSR